MTITTQTQIAPVAQANRIKLIDALRGVALLGILLMNIPGFSMPNYFSETFKNEPASLNFWVGEVITVVFEGKMRALFSMLFGAGILLFISKKEGVGVHFLFYRRMFWLALFGLIHAHLILWIGDILYLYGVCGMLVYLCRNINPKYLVLAIPIVAILDFGLNTYFYQGVRNDRIAYVNAKKVETEKKPLTATQTNALTTWREIETSMIPNREDAKENTRKMKSDYATVASYLRPMAWDGQTEFMLYEIWDCIALMLLGFALYKWGFLSGSWSNAAYRKVMLIGYGIGLPLVLYSSYYGFVNFSTLEANLKRMEQVPINWIDLIYPFQRIFLVMAHASFLILLYKSGKMQGIFRRLVSVGQMAFTNYIMHSIICTLFFFGYGLNYFARFDYYQIYFVVVTIWIVQLIISPIWLRYFYFGPLEWLWRSLTYWKVQPFKRG